MTWNEVRTAGGLGKPVLFDGALCYVVKFRRQEEIRVRPIHGGESFVVTADQLSSPGENSTQEQTK